MAKFSVTYETWTPEDAEAGDTDDRGFVAQDVSLREAIGLMGRHATEASSWPMQAGDWFTNSEYDHDYRTGAVEQRSLHPPRTITLASTRRIARLLGCRS